MLFIANIDFWNVVAQFQALTEQPWSVFQYWIFCKSIWASKLFPCDRIRQLKSSKMTANIKTVPTSEYDAVIQTANKYTEGLRSGSADAVAQAFHKDAVMYGFINPPEPDMLAGPIDTLYTFVRDNGSAPGIKTRNDVLAITQTTAVVRIDMEGDGSGADYTDFLTLIKIESQWQVIAKVFHKYA
ncbi:unnamed protein product [Penicillium bialowiezense]